MVKFATCLQSGLGRVKSNLASSVKRGKMTKEAADAVAARVKGTLDYSDFGSVDMVSPADMQWRLLDSTSPCSETTHTYNVTLPP